jgi:hypothetical protein
MADVEDPAPPPPPFEAAGVPDRALRTYARLWQFETWLRRMVYVELRAKLGDGWAAGLSTSPGSMSADKRLRHMPTPQMNALSYSQLSTLLKLVADHWECFSSYLPPDDLWKAKLAEVSQIRHRIAHFRQGHADDYVRLLQFLRDVDQGFWNFCTSYNDLRPVLPQSDDTVTAHFLELDPLPYGEMQPGHWARVGFVDKTAVIGMTVHVLRRPWAETARPVAGATGYLYDFNLRANGGRHFDYEALLKRTELLHPHLVHIGLDQFEQTLRLTVPAVLGGETIIKLVEEVLEAARGSVGRGRNPVALLPEEVAASWPEYVLGPMDPLNYLDPQMPCSFFSAEAPAGA